MYHKIVLLLLLSLGLQSTKAQDAYMASLAEARAFHQKGQYKKASRIFLAAFETRSPRTSELNIALSALTQAGKFDDAFAIMQLGINSGWLTLDHLLSDSTLEPLHAEERWEELTQRLARFSIGENHELRERLVTIAERDQYYRVQMSEQAKEHGWGAPVIKEMYSLQRQLDSLNYLQIDTIIARHGYPGRSMVGPQGSTAFLVIQRAPLTEQLKHLSTLQAAADQGELLWSDLAILIDKIKMAQDEPQVYGTQVIRSADGLPEFYTIADPEMLDERRRTAHLMPMAQYASRFGLKW